MTRRGRSPAAGRSAAEPTTLPVLDPDPPTARSALPTRDSNKSCTTTAEKSAPAWRNEVTLLSLGFLRAYEPANWIHLIAPLPCSWWSPLWTASPTVSSRQLPSKRRCTQGLVLTPGEAASTPTRASASDPARSRPRDWFVDHLITKT